MKPGPRRKERARPPKPSVIQQARTDQFTKWTVDLVSSALDEHEQGDFTRSANLVDSMGRDDRISGVVETRVNAVVGKNGPAFTIEPPEGKSSELAKRVEAWWFDVVSDDVSKKVVTDMVLMGFSIWRIHWALMEREWRPERLERWHPHNVRWDDAIHRFIARTEGDEEVIEPGDPNWLVVTPGGPHSWMGGAVRCLGLPFLMRQFNFRDWTRFNERHGLPIITVEEPPTADDRRRQDFYLSLQKMGRGGIVRLPQNQAGVGYKLGLIEAKDTAHASFTQFRQDLDIGIAVRLLGQNLTTEVKGGSYAAATAHDRIRQDYLEADTEYLCTAFREGLLVPYTLYNVPSATEEDAPWPTYATAAPVDRKAEAETAKTGAEAVTAWRKTKMPIDFKALLERLKMPVLEGKDPNDAEPMDPEPQPVPFGGQPGGQPGTTKDPKKTKDGVKQRLASGARLAANQGFVDGQLYADDLVDAYARQAAKDQSTFLTDLVALCQKGSSYEEIRDLVLQHYQGAATPVELRDTLQKVLVLAGFAGQHAVLEDA